MTQKTICLALSPKLRREVENSESKTPITIKVSCNQSLGYRKFKRSLNVKSLLSAILSLNLGKAQKLVKTEEVLQQVSHSKNPHSCQRKYGHSDKGMRVI